MTANAFMSGSMTPPLCVVSIAKRAHTHALIAAAEKFGVTVLAEHQESIARRFAGQPIDGADVGFVELARVPVLSEGVARIATTLHAAVDCGDHTLYIGEILDVIVRIIRRCSTIAPRSGCFARTAPPRFRRRSSGRAPQPAAPGFPVQRLLCEPSQNAPFLEFLQPQR